MPLILASTSPRRKEILALLGVPFETVAPAYEESPLPGRAIEDEVLEFAAGKARSVARFHPDDLVIGSDTMIRVDTTKVGKPVDRDDARRILRLLSGRPHEILTSVAIIDGSGGGGLAHVEKVRVRMRAYGGREIERYLAGDEWVDKAGAYSIQGAGRALIESIEGDYLAAVGLPLRAIAAYLAERGHDVTGVVERVYAERRFPNWQTFA